MLLFSKPHLRFCFFSSDMVIIKSGLFDCNDFADSASILKCRVALPGIPLPMANPYSWAYTVQPCSQIHFIKADGRNLFFKGGLRTAVAKVTLH